MYCYTQTDRLSSLCQGHISPSHWPLTETSWENNYRNCAFSSVNMGGRFPSFIIPSRWCKFKWCDVLWGRELLQHIQCCCVPLPCWIQNGSVLLHTQVMDNHPLTAVVKIQNKTQRYYPAAAWSVPLHSHACTSAVWCFSDGATEPLASLIYVFVG